MIKIENLNIEIKDLCEVDKDKFTQLWNESHSDHFHKWNKTKEEIYERNRIFNIADKDFSKVAVHIEKDSEGNINEKLIGFIINGIGTIDGKKIGWNGATAVLKEYRNLGIATLIYNSIIDQYRKHNFDQAVLELITINEKAFNLYKKLGFKITSNHTICEINLNEELINSLQSSSNEINSNLEFIKDIECSEYHLKNQHPTTQYQNLLSHNFKLVNIVSSTSTKDIFGYMYYSISFDKSSIIFHQLYLNDDSLITNNTLSLILNFYFKNYGNKKLVIYCWNINNNITKLIQDFTINDIKQFKKSFDYYTMKLDL